MDVNKLTEQFQTKEELQIFAGSQFKQILQLSKKNKELEEQNLELKKQSKDIVKKELNTSPILLEAGNIKGQEDAKQIAQVQLRMLKDIAFDRELTLEEAKRVELFNRILTEQSKEDDKPLKANVKVIKNDDLLRIIDDGT